MLFSPDFNQFYLDRKPDDPTSAATPPPPFRRLRGFAFDPSLSLRLDTATINQTTFEAPWEHKLEPGPVGEYLEVLDYDPGSGCWYAPVDLNDLEVVAQDGLAPSEGNPQFHQQMVYAAAMNTIANFERALGRQIFWAPIYDEKLPTGKREVYVQRLRIYPHALRAANAYYSPNKRALLFGYFPGSSGMVFSCLSHDIIAHETTHALLDGMHRRYIEDNHEDSLAFHEAFADLVALFEHFTFSEVLRHQVAAAGIAAPVTNAIDQTFGTGDNQRQFNNIQAAQTSRYGFGGTLASEFLKSTTRQAANILVNRGGRLEWSSIAVDTFGNAIGNTLANSLAEKQRASNANQKLAANPPSLQDRMANAPDLHIVNGQAYDAHGNPVNTPMMLAGNGIQQRDYLTIDGPEFDPNAKDGNNAYGVNIKQGDTLSSIAAKYGYTADELARFNGIQDPNRINAGDTLKLPNDQEYNQLRSEEMQGRMEAAVQGASFQASLARGRAESIFNVSSNSGSGGNVSGSSYF